MKSRRRPVSTPTKEETSSESVVRGKSDTDRRTPVRVDRTENQVGPVRSRTSQVPLPVDGPSLRPNTFLRPSGNRTNWLSILRAYSRSGLVFF